MDIIHMLSVFGFCFIAVTFGEYLAWIKMFKKWWGVSRMREIKFRVFDNELKYMHVCGENQHDTICFYGNNIATYYNLQNGCGSLKDGEGNSTYELMQYTGLKDKNGVEIYEGDIITNHVSTLKAVIKFGEFTPDVLDSWMMQFKNRFMESCQGYYAEIIIGNPVGQQMFLSKDIRVEVIGNIHQNPELLVVGRE